jgi:PIN domain nuclease of toxin-antitoxin system
MNLLLDTHIFIWWNAQSAQLSSKTIALIQDRTNRVFLSLVSVWEMQLKLQSNKLTLPSPLAKIIETQQQSNRVELLPVMLPHVLALDSLPSHHKDPFDRLLIAQARTENLTLISHDSVFTKYPVQIIW